jgi:hypothetical protein
VTRIPPSRFPLAVRSGLRAEVAEWQTRRSQTPLRATSCGFESHLRYQRFTHETELQRPSDCSGSNVDYLTLFGPRAYLAVEDVSPPEVDLAKRRTPDDLRAELDVLTDELLRRKERQEPSG